MGVLRIASFFAVDNLVNACKDILDSDAFSAVDLCLLYKEARSSDFDGMCGFLTDLIPKKTNSGNIC